MTDITTPAQMREALDAALADYTPGIDCAVRFVTIDQVDMLAEFYLHNRALPVSEPEPLAVRVKPLVWEETHDDRGDGSSEHNGCYEASTALGVYEISMGFGSDAYYWSACDPNYNEIGSFEDPSYAKAAAQADYAAALRAIAGESQ